MGQLHRFAGTVQVWRTVTDGRLTGMGQLHRFAGTVQVWRTVTGGRLTGVGQLHRFAGTVQVWRTVTGGRLTGVGQLHRFYCINVPRFDSGPTLRGFTILLHSRVSKELSFVVVAVCKKNKLHKDRYRYIC